MYNIVSFNPTSEFQFPNHRITHNIQFVNYIILGC